MSGKPGKSGPPQNLNAARHGLTSWLKRRALPRQKQHIVKLVQEYRDGLLTCKGGPGTATEVEIAVIENASRAYGACLLVLEEAAVRGLVRQVDGTWDLTPGFARLAAFLNCERQALLGLGLARRPREVGEDIVSRARRLASQQEEEWRREREADEKQSEDGDDAEA